MKTLRPTNTAKRVCSNCGVSVMRNPFIGGSDLRVWIHYNTGLSSCSPEQVGKGMIMGRDRATPVWVRETS